MYGLWPPSTQRPGGSHPDPLCPGLSNSKPARETGHWKEHHAGNGSLLRPPMAEDLPAWSSFLWTQTTNVRRRMRAAGAISAFLPVLGRSKVSATSRSWKRRQVSGSARRRVDAAQLARPRDWMGSQPNLLGKRLCLRSGNPVLGMGIYRPRLGRSHPCHSQGERCVDRRSQKTRRTTPALLEQRYGRLYANVESV